MQTRLLGLMLLTGCYVPLSDQPAPQCSDDGCSSHVRTLTLQRSKPETQTLGISIAIPTTTAECNDVLLTVVGAKRAVLGEHVILEAAASGDDPAPTLLWESEDTEVTAVGPASAEVSCDTLGVHTINVELAPPAPCPAPLRVDVECIEARPR